ncbi:DUF3160 domain-containing protein [Pontiellaceae bacterium B1224]|nr:DUF3160 domain-containing protein [Pontiellaceae bacterium B1224]
MKPGYRKLCMLSFAIALTAMGEPTLKLERGNEGYDLSWPSTTNVTIDGLMHPYYKIQYSDDLENWTTRYTVRDVIGGSTDTLLQELGIPSDAHGYYRIIEQQKRAVALDGGEEVFGFGTAFDEQLSAVGELSVEGFSSMYPPGDYLEELSFDPETVDFYTNLSSGYVDYSLNEAEATLFRKNGFVVSSRLGEESFAELYFRIYVNDLPVFVSTDSILHAWHRTYIGLLAETEEAILVQLLETILEETQSALAGNSVFAADPLLGEGVHNADIFLGVARGLLDESATLSTLGNELVATGHVAAAVAAEETGRQIFEAPRDMSQFIVRGHYAETEALTGYFRAMMWLGRIDLRVTPTNVNDRDASLRDLVTAMTLCFSLRDAGQEEAWQYMEDIIRTYVGPADSMLLPQLGELLDAAGIQSLSDISGRQDLVDFQDMILEGELGLQNISSHLYASPLSSEQVTLPRSCTFFGQRYIIDSWVLSKMTYDDIRWSGTPPYPADELMDPSAPVPPRILADKVVRRIPSGLDVSFAALGNDHVVPIITNRIDGVYEPGTNGLYHFTGRAFRDGVPYQHHLAACRKVVDGMETDAWKENIYSGWLYALRALSEPIADERYPEAMRTRAWGLKTTETQLASWTQLRHDTILYAKQSYSSGDSCEYPYGFVEPQVTFYERLAEVADFAADRIGSMSVTGSFAIARQAYGQTWSSTYDRAHLQSREVAHLRSFAETMEFLAEMSRKELAQELFADEEEQFLEQVVYLACGVIGGWYPRLMYNPYGESIGFWEGFVDPLVADVHTDQPSDMVGDPGMVLHQGVGYPQMMIMAVDNGPDRRVYCGPVFSYYEFEMPNGKRMTDSEWRNQDPPSSPEWTRTFRVKE